MVLKTNRILRVMICIGVLMLYGMTTNAQKTYNFKYEDDGTQYDGSFEYMFYARSAEREQQDLLVSNTVDVAEFSTIYVKVANLKLDPNSDQEITIYFKSKWHKYNDNQLTISSNKDRTLYLGRKAQSIKFNTGSGIGGKVNIDIGFDSKEGESPSNKLSLSFIVEGSESESGGGEGNTPPPKPPSPPSDEIDPKVEQANLWNAAMTMKTVGNFTNYINKYPESPNAEIARREIELLRKEKETTIIEEPTIEEPTIVIKNSGEGKKVEKPENLEMEFDIKQEGNYYYVNVKNARSPKVANVTPNDGGVMYMEEGNQIKISIGNKQDYSFIIKDDKGRTKSFELNPSIAPIEGSIISENGRLVYNASGGEPPYSIEIIKVSDGYEEVMGRQELEGNDGTIAFNKLKARKLHGGYTIKLLDKRKTLSQDFPGIYIKQENGIPPLAILGILAVLLVGLIVFIVKKAKAV